MKVARQLITGERPVPRIDQESPSRKLDRWECEPPSTREVVHQEPGAGGSRRENSFDPFRDWSVYDFKRYKDTNILSQHHANYIARASKLAESRAAEIQVAKKDLELFLQVQAAAAAPAQIWNIRTYLNRLLRQKEHKDALQRFDPPSAKTCRVDDVDDLCKRLGIKNAHDFRNKVDKRIEQLKNQLDDLQKFNIVGFAPVAWDAERIDKAGIDPSAVAVAFCYVSLNFLCCGQNESYRAFVRATKPKLLQDVFEAYHSVFTGVLGVAPISVPDHILDIGKDGLAKLIAAREKLFPNSRYAVVDSKKKVDYKINQVLLILMNNYEFINISDCKSISIVNFKFIVFIKNNLN